MTDINDTSFNPGHKGVDDWHRQNQAPGNVTPNPEARPGNAPGSNPGGPEKK